MSISSDNTSDYLLIRNQELAKKSMGYRYELLDWSVITSRRDACRRLSMEEQWNPGGKNYLLLPDLMPRSDELAEQYAQNSEDLTLGAGIEQYIDVHFKDPHLFTPLLELRQAVIDLGFDPNFQETNTSGLRPYFLVSFASGDGSVLRELINIFKPYHLVIALADWQDLGTSFWDLDWKKIAHEQETVRGGQISIGCYQHGGDILSFLIGECHAGVDHTVLHLPLDGTCDVKAKEARDQITSVDLFNSVTYLGYTIDELNMVWNTWYSLSCQPRLFRKPQNPLGGRMVVCGSGPSLDPNLNDLRELSRTHWVTACGSNFRTLKANGIRVDFLALVERADVVFYDVEKVVREFGAGETRLVMSSTCHYQMLNMFCDNMIYFRPALTPLSLFSNSPDEVLYFEGPESINAGIAWAAAVGMDEVVLVGVDLGARSLKKIRSEDAVGCSVRDLDMQVTANFGGTVYTSPLLRDSRVSVECCLKSFKDLQVYNASDGVAIEGANPCSMTERLSSLIEEDSLMSFDETSLGQWFGLSQHYSVERFKSSWISRRPRAETSLLVASLRRLFSSSEAWNPTVIYEVNKLLHISNVPLASQFPRRVLRSTITKLVIAVNRQLIVMTEDPEKAALFEKAARRILSDALGPMEQEIYALCDSVENLPA